MPDKKSPENESSEPEKSGGSKRVLMAAILSVGLIGAGYMVGGKMGGGAAAAPAADATEAEEEEVEEEKKELGVLVDLEPVNVNLEGGHFLRVAVSLELSAESKYAKVDEKKKEGKVFPTAPAADLVLSTFSGLTIEELSTPQGREAARSQLFEDVEYVYHGEVVSLYFTEFVMQ